MLSKEALDSSIPLTTVLDSRNLKLVPIPGTPLAALVGATRCDANFISTTDTEVLVDTSSISYIANAKDDVLGYSPHDMVMDEVVSVAAPAVRGHISFARTVVVPAVASLAEIVLKRLNETSISELLKMEVVVWNPPSILNNNAFADMVAKYDEVPFETPDLKMSLPTITVAEMRDLMHTGAGGMDALIDEWVAVKGESFFISLWENIFQQKPRDLPNAPVITFREYVNHPESGLDYALGIFLLANKLVDAPLPGTEMGLALYNDLIVRLRNQAGLSLHLQAVKLDEIIKNGILVRAIDGNVTTVNGSVYSEWLDAGGDIEVLFGNLLDKPSRMSVSTINADAANLKATWVRHSLYKATAENNRRFNRLKEILLNEFNQSLLDIASEEPEVAKNAEDVRARFVKELDYVVEADLENIPMLCLKLVCRSRFHTTQAERILTGIEDVKRQNPDIDIREAAEISAHQYISYWVSSQFRVVAI